jgi:prepilin-type N-terminal cleavage/methylation domain-containing protein
MNSKIRANSAFTLIELLVVIAIIGILAAMLLPVLSSATNASKKTKAKEEAQAIATAIEQYDSNYGRFPVSQQAQTAAHANVNPGNPNGSDFTYGGVFKGGSVFTPGYQATNDEVIAILMDLTNYPGGGSTINANHQKNPKQTIFLNAKMSGWNPSQGGTPQPGVGSDLVYRDPWGNPYIISMDLNYDDQCEDVFYSLQAVSKQNGQAGYNGLFNSTDVNGAGNHFRYHGKVMVWSAGQDGKIDSEDPATDSENKNNVLSWQ